MNDNNPLKNIKFDLKPLNNLQGQYNAMVQQTNDSWNQVREFHLEKARKEEEDRIALHRQTKYLEDIRNKMYDIKDIMEVLRVNSNQTAEILPLITEILLLSQSTTVEQASSKFDDILDKLKGFKENFELYEFLHGAAKGGYEFIMMKLKGEI
ncbi:hypothetical protein [Metasolibacillus sp.]|uniref:hypothetical protein n=1 Tax=Metasolibacillus sp. TaxID=2703680 RepID=UPI0025CDD894|nr:hypothetical protein [Metasolibacillus sp.]MCT6924077.1 hypothetical protein [Metasolibacillus sp.]MCT6940184.1 hypothetical protein [Metasolibacillus sp.]